MRNGFKSVQTGIYFRDTLYESLRTKENNLLEDILYYILYCLLITIDLTVTLILDRGASTTFNKNFIGEILHRKVVRTGLFRG